MTNPNDFAFQGKEDQHFDVPVGVRVSCGLTKREYFAAMLANNQPFLRAYMTPEQTKEGQQDWAHNVVSNADALIAELNK